MCGSAHTYCACTCVYIYIFCEKRTQAGIKQTRKFKIKFPITHNTYSKHAPWFHNGNHVPKKNKTKLNFGGKLKKNNKTVRR